jgi:hypothetical protein
MTVMRKNIDIDFKLLILIFIYTPPNTGNWTRATCIQRLLPLGLRRHGAATQYQS